MECVHYKKIKEKVLQEQKKDTKNKSKITDETLVSSVIQIIKQEMFNKKWYAQFIQN